MKVKLSKVDEMLKTIDQYGVKAKGRSELTKHLYGERLTSRQMIMAKCYDCMGYFSDGRGADCEIKECSLYPVMPYRQKGEKHTTKTMSEENKQKNRDRMLARHAK